MADETTGVDREALLEESERLAGQGYRVLAMAFRFLESIPTEWMPDVLEKDLTL